MSCARFKHPVLPVHFGDNGNREPDCGKMEALGGVGLTKFGCIRPVDSQINPMLRFSFSGRSVAHSSNGVI